MFFFGVSIKYCNKYHSKKKYIVINIIFDREVTISDANSTTLVSPVVHQRSASATFNKPNSEFLEETSMFLSLTYSPILYIFLLIKI